MIELLVDFKKNMIADRLSQDTVENYVIYLKHFFITKNVKSSSDITSKLVMDYCAEENSKWGFSRSNGFRAGLKKFIDYHDLQGIRLPKNKTAKTVNTRIPLNDEEFNKLINGIDNNFCRNPYRIRALIGFLAYTGLRVGEVERLKRVDIEGKDRLVIHQKKSASPRLVTIIPPLKALLDKYFLTEQEENNLFNMKTCSMHRWVQKAILKILGKKGFPHLLRHSFVSLCHRKGVDIKSIQVAIGHATIQQTENYLKADSKIMAQEIENKIKGINMLTLV